MIDISKIVLCVFEKKMFCLLEYDKKENKQTISNNTYTHSMRFFFYTLKRQKQKRIWHIDIYIVNAKQF